jgi:hypothetical protein
MKGLNHVTVLILLTFSLSLPAQGKEMQKEGAGNRYWIDAMAEVHERFSGEKGTFAHFGKAHSSATRAE